MSEEDVGATVFAVIMFVEFVEFVEFVVLVILIAVPEIADHLVEALSPLLEALARPVAALIRFVEWTFKELASLLRRGSG